MCRSKSIILSETGFDTHRALPVRNLSFRSELLHVFQYACHETETGTGTGAGNPLGFYFFPAALPIDALLLEK